MSWFNRKILTEEDVRNGTACELPSYMQVGDDAKLWVFDEARQAKSIPCKIAGVDIEAHHAIRYNLAFRIEGTDLYVKSDDYRGYVTPADVMEIERAGGLVDVDEVKKELNEAPALTERLLGRA